MTKQEGLDPDWVWIKIFKLLADIKVGDIIYTCGLVCLDRHRYVNDILKIKTFIKGISQYSEFSKGRLEEFAYSNSASAADGTLSLIKPSSLVKV